MKGFRASTLKQFLIVKIVFKFNFQIEIEVIYSRLHFGEASNAHISQTFSELKNVFRTETDNL